ncbi:MAG: hypothetical protein CMC96_08890 [Flavobacteriales bacterium]|nr:hypothetical protein [Flavobacteriales bacterium]|tara:strand:- start:1094 stop:1960 length:867 start_codon:yes stop_codon:yes gene_type:complete
MLVDTKISALIKLLDDPDELIYHQVSQELLDLGDEAVPHLEEVWEHAFDATMQERIEQILHQIQFQTVYSRLQQWKNSKEKSLLQAALIIAKYQYAELNEEEIYGFVDKLRQDIWLELNDNLTALEKVVVFNRVFFDHYGFKGNRRNFHAARNSFINNVVESKIGNPLSLSIIYLEVAQKLKLPIYGVNLPELFVMVYTRLPIEYLDHPIHNEDILFYINPYNRGRIFSAKEIKKFLAELKIEEQKEFFTPCDQSKIVRRMISNLIFAYHKNGKNEKIHELKMLIKLI